MRGYVETERWGYRTLDLATVADNDLLTSEPAG